MYLVVSILVLRAGCGIWLYQFLIIAYLFTFHIFQVGICYQVSHLVTKPTKWSAQSDQSSLSAWRKFESSANHWVRAKTLIRLGWCLGLSEFSLGAHVSLLVLSRGGSGYGCQVFTWLMESAKKYEPRHDKTNKVTVRPVKTQISLGIHPVWSESSLSAWRNLGSLATHWGHSEDSDQTGRMPRLIWVFAGRTVILLVLSWDGSYKKNAGDHWKD